MVIERRASQISGHSSEIEAPTSPIEGRAFFIGNPTLAVEARSFSIKCATPGLAERTLPLERASLRIERSSLPLVPSSLLIRSRACHPERRARLCAWRSAIVRHPRVAKDLLFSYLCRSSLYAGADIGQKEIPVRLARCADRRHCVASRQGRPRGEALHRVERRARDRRRLRIQD